MSADPVVCENQRITSKIGTNMKSVYYPSDTIFAIKGPCQPVYQVTKESTIAALKRLVVEENAGKTVALNFANATNPGGGYLRGALAQEEMICQASGLLPCIVEQKQFYVDNMDRENMTQTYLYTNDMIYSPDVPVIRDDDDTLISPFLASFITSPAPCLIDGRQKRTPTRDEANQALLVRIRKIILLAISKGYKNIVLGAFGCGAFRNNPVDVANIFSIVLKAEGYETFFNRIVFAIKSKPGAVSANYTEFEKVFR